jgi:hypothetical protein
MLTEAAGTVFALGEGKMTEQHFLHLSARLVAVPLPPCPATIQPGWWKKQWRADLLGRWQAVMARRGWVFEY